MRESTRRTAAPAPAIIRIDQPRNIDRVHLRPRLVSKRADERREPPLEIGLAVLVNARTSETIIHELRKISRRNSKNAPPPKILPK
jgi:hypothetical protein